MSKDGQETPDFITVSKLVLNDKLCDEDETDYVKKSLLQILQKVPKMSLVFGEPSKWEL